MVTQTVTRTLPEGGVAPTFSLTGMSSGPPSVSASAAAAAPALPATSATAKKKLYLGYFRTEVVWKNVLGFFILHLIALYGLWVMIMKASILTYFYIWASGVVTGVGVTVGAHRLFTHRCFRATWGVRLALVILHTIAGQNCMYVWVRDHRQHHRYSDTDGDPHNVNRGFFFSHIGWLMMKKHPAVIEKGKNIDLSDLDADPFVMFQKKYYKTLYALFAILLPVSIPILLWNEDVEVAIFGCYFFRMIIVLNFTWLVNSAAHMFGTRPFNKNIEPVESELVALLSLGEGWHNYHHCFPWDYRAAELGSKYDLSTKVIDWLAKKGWVSDLKFASDSLVRKRAATMGDGSHARYGGDADASDARRHPHAHMADETPLSAASVKWAKLEAEGAAAAAAGGRDFVSTTLSKEASAMSLS